MGNEKEKLKAPLPATLYGFPVYYRIEMRAGKETLILSYRSEDTGKIEYEASRSRLGCNDRRLLLRRAEECTYV